MQTSRNPWDLATHRVPGGSSSGTGVAVAAGFAPVGIGSDTGGSVRIPSAFNGLTGLKVTYGRISLYGTGLLSWTLDSIGPMARNVRDCALLLDALAAPDPRDPVTLVQPPEQFSREARSVRGLRLALPDVTQLPDFMHPGVTQAWQDAAKVFESLGAQIVPVRLPDWFFGLSVNTGRIIACEAHALHRAFANWFEPFDALLLPSAAIPAMAVQQVDEASPIPGALTRQANYLGLCALSQPAGLVEGLPVGLQIVGKPFDERTVLSLGQAFEQATPHHRLHPDLSALALD